MPHFGVVICVGPGEKERTRFDDFVHSLLFYEPTVSGLAVIDDEIPKRDLLSRFTIPAHCRAEVMTNPRRGRGSGWGAGLTAAILLGIQWLHNNVRPQFVVKVDTDTLIIGEFANRIFNHFITNPDEGMLGSFLKYPDRPRDFYKEREVAPAIEKLLRQFTIWRKTCSPFPRIQIGYFGKYGRIRSILQQALLNGYVLGEYCCGGGYAISEAAINLMAEEGLLRDPLLWLHTPCSDDVVLSLYVRTIRKRIADFNAEGEPFGVKGPGLPFSPEILVQKGYAIIHSLKNYKGTSEDKTRAFFESRRNNSR
jgi:hypothetical protein